MCDRGQAVFDWNDLRYLVAVAEAGTLVGAGRELGVKHTTVARRLAALEHALGSRLVRKGADRYTLTPAGHEVLAFAAELKAKADVLERGVAGRDGIVAGAVRVTMPDTIAGWFVRQLPALRQRHPDLTVDVLADMRVYDLLGGEADVALRMFAKSEGELVERKLCVPVWALYAARSYAASRGLPKIIADAVDLRGHDLVGLEGPAISQSPGGEWYRENAPGAQFILRCNSAVQAFNAVLMGTGIGPLPCFMGDAEPLLVRAAPDTFSNRRMRMVVPHDLVGLARVRAVMDYVVEIAARDADLFEGRQPQEALGS
jgi:DNA-binding transcriptional LysR family regulator